MAAGRHQAGQGPYRQGLSAEYLRALISYDPETGHFTWRISRSNVRAGERAGCSRDDGYRLIRIDRTMYLEHRLAWLYVHGEWPSQFIDHMNGDPTDNRIANLREATPQINQQNRRKSKNPIGLVGVRRTRCGNYQARIGHNKQETVLGTFQTPEEAYEVYLTAKRRLHEGCTI